MCVYCREQIIDKSFPKCETVSSDSYFSLILCFVKNIPTRRCFVPITVKSLRGEEVRSRSKSLWELWDTLSLWALGKSHFKTVILPPISPPSFSASRLPITNLSALEKNPQPGDCQLYSVHYTELSWRLMIGWDWLWCTILQAAFSNFKWPAGKWPQ